VSIWSSVRGAFRRAPEIQASSPENPSTPLSDPAQWLLGWGDNTGTFGPPINERTAMACSAVYRCVALKSGIRASLPLKVYRRTKDGREEAPTHRLAPMFQVAPYPGRPLTAFAWRELWGVNEMLWGDHFSAIRYDGAARIVGFEPKMPWQTDVQRRNGRNLYRFETPVPGGDPTVEWLDQDDVIHIAGIGFDGIRGMSVIRANAHNSVALSAMLLEQIGRVHENAARPSGMAVAPAGVSEKAFLRFKTQFTQNNTGRTNAGKVIFGEPGWDFKPLQMSPEDLHTLELMRFTVADISRFYGVPLHLLNETDKSTSWGSGIAEQSLGFLIYSIEPDLGRIEAELNYKLFNGTDYYVEFDRDALMAMDPLKAANVASIEIACGTLPNEYRRQKNRPPHKWGDEPMMNGANVPLSKIMDPDAQPRMDPIQSDALPPRDPLGANSGGPPVNDNNSSEENAA
jgi:HK97 family phage portal protein